MDLWWCSLPERNGVANYDVYNSMLEVATAAGVAGYQRIGIGYARTDFARNEVTRKFMELSKRDDDLVVMLDADHKHPRDILNRFASHDSKLGVVGALAFRRGEPYDPLFFIRDAKGGGLYAPAEFQLGPVYQCAIVSTSAIAIRRWVLLELERKGYGWPWFRYEYPTNQALPSEDMYFGWVCEHAGIWHHCDTSMVIPHATLSWVDEHVQQEYIKLHPELAAGSATISGVVA